MTPDDRRLRVVSACFDGLPEADYLQAAARGLASLEIIEERQHVVRHVLARRPGVLLAPVIDASGVATKWIVQDCLEAVPDLKVLMLVSGVAGLGHALQGLPEHRVWITNVRSSHELRDALERIVDGGGLSEDESLQIKVVLDGIRPAEFREVLTVAVQYAGRHLNAQSLSRLTGINRRSLAQRARTGGWPSLSETAKWGGLFRAALTGARVDHVSHLARLAGFDGPSALRKTCRAYLGIHLFSSADLTVGAVSIRLQQRMSALAAGRRKDSKKRPAS